MVSTSSPMTAAPAAPPTGPEANFCTIAASSRRSVVSSPSSYLYLDARRLKADAICPDDAGCTVDMTSFETPYWDSASCPTYDEYKYGLLARTGYLKTIPTPLLAPRYVSRDVLYLLSEKDSGNIPGAAFGELDVGCEATAEGPVGSSFRLQRGLVYHRYVNEVLGALHRVAVVPACGHLHTCVLTTQRAQDEMFGP